MQNYYSQTLFKNSGSNTVVLLSFVGTLASTFCTSFSPIVQICVGKIGLRTVMFVGSFLAILGMEMAAFSTKVWHLVVTQAIIFGIGTSCMYGTGFFVVSQWFTKKLGRAQGVNSGGSGIGGLIVPFIITPINNKLGAAWTYRIMGAVCFVFYFFTCVFVKERKSLEQRQSEKRQSKTFADLLDIKVLKNRNFLIFVVAANLNLLAYFVPFFFVPSYATYLNLTAHDGSLLVSVASAMNFLGRFASGYLGDRIGSINSYILFVSVTALSHFLIWTFAHTYGTLMVFCIVWGFACGSYYSLLSSITTNILGPAKIFSGMSLMLFSNALAFFGPNIISAIEAYLLQQPGYQPFLSYKLFSGACNLLSAVVLLYLQWRVRRKRRATREQ